MSRTSFRTILLDERVLWAGLFVLACLAMDLSLLNPLCEDSAGYIEPAQNLLSSAAYTSVIRPPAYPLFLAGHLALWGHHGLMASVWSQRVLWLAGILLLFPNPESGCVSDALSSRMGKAVALFMPQVLVNCSLYLSDALFAVLICGGLFFARRLSRGQARFDGLCSGVLLGLATMTRPVALLLPLVLATGILVVRSVQYPRLRHQTAIACLVLVCAASTFPLGWAFRNRIVSGHFALSPLTGYNLALHNLKTVRELDGQHVYPPGSPQGEFSKVAAASGSIPAALSHISKLYSLDAFDADDVAKTVALDAIRKRPGRYLGNTAAHGFRLFLAPSDGFDLLTSFFGKPPALVAPLAEALRKHLWTALLAHIAIRTLSLVFLMVLPSILLWRRLRGSRPVEPELMVMLVALLYFVIFSAAFIPTNGRFLLPVFPSLYYLYIRPSSKDQRTGLRP